MVYETKGPVQQSVQISSTVADKCSDMLYKARCLKNLNEGFYLPVAEFYAAQDPPVTLQGDPLTMAWNMLRQGGFLCTLLNEYRGNTIDPKSITPIPTDGSLTEEHFRNKAAHDNVSKFVACCKDELFMQEHELFKPDDLYGENMNSLTKALNITDEFFNKLKRVRGINFIKRIKDMKEVEAVAAAANGDGPSGTTGGAASASESAPVDKRLRAIEEIKTSERSYVSDLDHLFKYYDELKISKVVSDEVIRNIFCNFEELNNFQQRYSYLVESTISKAVLRDVAASQKAQVFKKLFIDQEGEFQVYMRYVANLANARATVKENMEPLMALRHIMDPQGQLDSFLIKPTQRLCKYPLLIREVIRNSAPDSPDMDEMQKAMEASHRNADRVNELLAEGDNVVEARRMQQLVTDWSWNKRPIDRNALGLLVRFDSQLAYIKEGSSPSEVGLYLFENMLLMCRPGKTMLRNTPNLVIKWATQCGNIHSYEDISRPTEPFYGLRMYYYSSGDTVNAVSFEAKNAERVRLWIKALQRLDIPNFDEVPSEEGSAESAPKQRASLFRRRSNAPSVASTTAAAAGGVAVGAAAFGGRDRRKSVASSVVSAESGEPAASAPGVQPNERSATTASSSSSAAAGPSISPMLTLPGPALSAINGYVQLKLCYQDQFYIVLLPHMPSIEQVKRLAVKTIKPDMEARGLGCELSRESVLIKYRDDTGDLINITDENCLVIAYKYVTPNRLTIHILDA